MRNTLIEKAINFLNHPETQDTSIDWKLVILEKRCGMTKKELDLVKQRAIADNLIAVHLGLRHKFTDWRIGWNDSVAAIK
jgi:hypothetical protein